MLAGRWRYCGSIAGISGTKLGSSPTLRFVGRSVCNTVEQVLIQLVNPSNIQHHPSVKGKKEKKCGDEHSDWMDSVVIGSLKVKDCVIFQCKRCHTVLGDSLQSCGSSLPLNMLICLRVTENVDMDPVSFIGCEGPMSKCYMLQSKSEVEPAALNLQPQCLTQHIGELKRQLVVAHYRLLAAMNKLDELVGEEGGLGTSVTLRHRH
ncbi:protein Mis18-beta isoform X2 [Rhincodon typus]|uniref:protein Mis18-beta isoform X2 n=1 Tax=Rhincodon typus TaxID=259920 RepID=UPI00202F613D|nr:protein Mis18-beta isoform X2 [Rhincodon typus]